MYIILIVWFIAVSLKKSKNLPPLTCNCQALFFQHFFRFTASKWRVNLKPLLQLESDLNSCRFLFEVKHSSNHLSSCECLSVWVSPLRQHTGSQSVPNLCLTDCLWTKLLPFSHLYPREQVGWQNFVQGYFRKPPPSHTTHTYTSCLCNTPSRPAPPTSVSLCLVDSSAACF